MKTHEDEAASRPDGENPEWTQEDFAKAQPVFDRGGEVFGAQVAEELRRRRGRPAKPDRKVNQTLRLDPEIVAAYRREGPGWQVHMNDVLREHMPKHDK